jgi:hypothetical protein
MVRPKERHVMSRKICSAALVLVLSALFVSSAYAQPPAAAAAEPRTGGFLAAAWDWFASLVLPAAPDHTFGVTVREKAGSQMDPDGQRNLLPRQTTEAGSSMDPDGNK